MEDKRIQKTRAKYKIALIVLLGKKRFEEISAADIYRQAGSAQSTFYVHYESKYALANDLMWDYSHEAENIYHQLQQKNNQQRNVILGYQNLMSAVVDLFFQHYSFFSHMSPLENPYLSSLCFHHIYYKVQTYISPHPGLSPRYSINQTTALLCDGIYGVITSCIDDKLSEDEVRRLTNAMFADLVNSRLFIT